MAFKDLSSVQIEKLVSLIKKKDTFEAQIATVDQSINALLNEKTGKASGKALPPRRTRKRRTSHKEAIVQVLKAAGPKGLSVEEIATSINGKKASVSVWLYTAGKKIKGLEKVSPGHFAVLP